MFGQALVVADGAPAAGDPGQSPLDHPSALLHLEKWQPDRRPANGRNQRVSAKNVRNPYMAGDAPLPTYAGASQIGWLGWVDFCRTLRAGGFDRISLRLASPRPEMTLQRAATPGSAEHGNVR